MPDIKITQQAFTEMVIITVSDDLTTQHLLLTPDEARALRDRLNNCELAKADPGLRDAAGHMRALTIYNGHSLPAIDRQKFETENTLTGPPFELRIVQRFKRNGCIIGVHVAGEI